jgi:hypothetical protein
MFLINRAKLVGYTTACTAHARLDLALLLWLWLAGAANLSGAVWTSSASTGSSSSSSSSPPLDVLGPSSTVTSAAGSSGEVQQWRLAHKQALRGRVTCCSVDGGGQLLVSGLRDGRVLAWNYSGLW